MRWTLIFVFCLAVASAKYGKKTRFGRMLQTAANLENDIEHDLQDTWDDDSDEYDDSDEDDVWQQPQRHHYQQQPRQKKQQKQCPNCGGPKKTQWKPMEEEDEYESEENEEYTRTPKKQQKHQKRHHRQERDEDEPQQQCKPNFDLMQKLDQSTAQMAARLHQEAKQTNDDKNTVVSPVAVQLALATVAQGARGTTKRQINQLLDYGMPKNQYQNAYAALIRALKGEGRGESSSKNAQIKSSTNLVFGQQSAQEQFIESIKSCFDGEVKKCDFRQKHQQCRDQINQWVSGKTGLKHQLALSQDAVTSNTKMISIGTMQLKANWGKQFRKNLKTTQGQFYALGDKKPTSVKVLETEGEFNYFEDDQMQVLGVQTQEKQMTVYVILPKERHGLNNLEKQRLQYGKQLQQLVNNCDRKKHALKVQLPTFQIAYKLDTKQMLKHMGVEDAFDGDEADFSGISEEAPEEHLLKHGRRQTGGLEDIDAKRAGQQQKQNQVHLNKLIQQATIQIDENGIDSASGQSRDSGKSKPAKESEEEREEFESDDTHFHADHAFAFIVKHNPSNQMLLMGRVIDATQKTEKETHGASEAELE